MVKRRTHDPTTRHHKIKTPPSPRGATLVCHTWYLQVFHTFGHDNFSWISRTLSGWSLPHVKEQFPSFVADGMLQLGFCGMHHLFALSLLWLGICIFQIYSQLFLGFRCIYGWALSKSLVINISVRAKLVGTNPAVCILPAVSCRASTPLVWVFSSLDFQWGPNVYIWSAFWLELDCVCVHHAPPRWMKRRSVTTGLCVPRPFLVWSFLRDWHPGKKCNRR